MFSFFPPDHIRPKIHDSCDILALKILVFRSVFPAFTNTLRYPTQAVIRYVEGNIWAKLNFRVTKKFELMV